METIRIFEDQIQTISQSLNWISLLKNPKAIKSKLERTISLNGSSSDSFSFESLNSFSIKTTNGGSAHFLMNYAHEISIKIEKDRNNIGMNIRPLGMKRLKISNHPSMFDSIDFSNSDVSVIANSREIPLQAYLSRRNITPLFFINHEDLQSSMLWLTAEVVKKKEV